MNRFLGRFGNAAPRLNLAYRVVLVGFGRTAHHEKGFTIRVLSDGISSGMNLRVKSEVRVGHELHLRDSLTIFIVTS